MGTRTVSYLNELSIEILYILSFLICHCINWKSILNHSSLMAFIPLSTWHLSWRSTSASRGPIRVWLASLQGRVAATKRNRTDGRRGGAGNQNIIGIINVCEITLYKQERTSQFWKYHSCLYTCKDFHGSAHCGLNKSRLFEQPNIFLIFKTEIFGRV